MESDKVKRSAGRPEKVVRFCRSVDSNGFGELKIGKKLVEDLMDLEPCGDLLTEREEQELHKLVYGRAAIVQRSWTEKEEAERNKVRPCIRPFDESSVSLDEIGMEDVE